MLIPDMNLDEVSAGFRQLGEEIERSTDRLSRQIERSLWLLLAICGTVAVLGSVAFAVVVLGL